MRNYLKFYINGQWVEPTQDKKLVVINPANEQVCGQIALGVQEDIDNAVKAARNAFSSWSQTSLDERLELLRSVEAQYQNRYDDMVEAITEEMGAPTAISRKVQAKMGLEHIRVAIKALTHYPFEERRGTTLLVKEPVGVCGFITPWNWPVNQISSKVAPALATACTIVLKPSEIAPFSSYLWAEIMHDAGVPAGVFNLVNGEGQTAGAALSSHPDVDMISFTGSTRAGIEVAKNAAPTVKRVHQELGGKSANILLEDADFDTAISNCINAVMMNSGQNCNAPTRLLVPNHKMDEVAKRAQKITLSLSVGDPGDDVDIGPVVSATQWEKIQSLIQKGMEEGARLVTGGTGKPEGLDKGYYVKPTVFSHVTNTMTIAVEEIFGPVVVIIGYDSVKQAINIANDTVYGLAGYVSGSEQTTVREVASKLRVGQVNLNSAAADLEAPFGGYKQSGNGREWGDYAFHDFLEVKAILGYGTN